MNPTRISIHALVAAPAQKVWESFTKPEHITKWNFASDDWFCPSASNDLRVGGRYIARMEAKDGSFGFDFDATYEEVVIGKKIAYTMFGNRKAITEFEDLGGQTKIKTTFDAENENPIEMQREGWQAILNNFKKYVESL